jgi:hypothetical protein
LEDEFRFNTGQGNSPPHNVYTVFDAHPEFYAMGTGTGVFSFGV